jgi:hypothetical protein
MTKREAGRRWCRGGSEEDAEEEADEEGGGGVHFHFGQGGQHLLSVVVFRSR